MSEMTDTQADDLIRLIKNEGRPVAEVYELHEVEDVDGNPIGVERRDLGSAAVMGPVRLTERQWKQLAHKCASWIHEDRRIDLLKSRPHLSWADVARTFINNLKEDTR